MADCFNHTGRPATDRCRQCGRPLCGECGVRRENGVFCGEKCAGDFTAFARKTEECAGKGSGRRPVGCRVLRLLVLLALVYAAWLIVRHFNLVP